MEVITTDEFAEWFEDLEDDFAREVRVKVDLLEAQGVALGFPHTSSIKNCRYSIRELRIQAKGHPLRVFYIFDLSQDAVLLLGGDKKGQDRFYKVFVPRAERLWEEYLEEYHSPS